MILKWKSNHWTNWIILTFKSEIVEKKNNFDFNNEVFDINSVKMFDLNYYAEKLSFTDQEYQKMKEILWISKIFKSKMMFMKTLFKSIYSSKKNLNEIMMIDKSVRHISMFREKKLMKKLKN